jgi:DNA-directed RNA polymerase specialized sigma24 family protein
MTTTRDALNRGKGAPLPRFFALPPEERLTAANALLDELRAVMTEVATSRREAVRDLRMTGYTLKEIADMVGTTPQRIHQIESGYNRKEKADRKRSA